MPAIPNSTPNFEKYCEKCKKYFVSSQRGAEKCTFCGEYLKIVLICKTCQRRYTVYEVLPGAKCPTCHVPLKIKSR
ncbi:MAG: hypothetical protein ACTSRS_19735 [Candidatus Helarchaeota archaeon]